MKQNENTNEIGKGIKKSFEKIFDGFLKQVGSSIALAIGSFLGLYFGGKEVSKPIMEEFNKRDSIYCETLARWDTISYIVNSKKDFDEAKKYELAGFHSLIDKKYGEAIWNFMMSENSANGYHASYDIAEYLRKNENSVSVPDFWENTYKHIIDNYRGYIPSDVLTEMRKTISSQK